MKKSTFSKFMSILLSAILLLSIAPLTFAADCEHTTVNDELVCEDCGEKINAKAVRTDGTVKYFTAIDDALYTVIKKSNLSSGYYEFGGSTLYLYSDCAVNIYLTHCNFRLNADGYTVSGSIYINDGASLTIDGGTFNTSINQQTDSSNLTITGGTFENKVEIYGASYTYFSGGTFNSRIYSHVDYDKFQIGNITCNGQIQIPGAGGITVNAGNYYGDITVSDGAHFYVPASSSAVFGSDMCVNINEFSDEGTKATIAGGTFHGTVNVYAGMLEMPMFARIATLNVYSTGKVSIEEGEFKSINCTMGQTCADLLAKRHVYYSTTDSAYISMDDCDVTEIENVRVKECPEHDYGDGTKCTVCRSTADAMVVDFNGNAEVFTELKDAFDYAGTLEYGATVMQLDDIDLKESLFLTSGTSIKFNMNGKSINNYYENNTSGILTTIPLTVTGNGLSSVYFGAAKMGTNDGQLTILNGTFNSFIAVSGDVALNILDGTFNGYVSVSTSEGTPTVKINGGSFKQIMATGEYYDFNSVLGENMLYKTTASEMFKQFTFNDRTVYGFDGTEEDAMLDVVYHGNHTSVTEDLKCTDCGVQTIAQTKINDDEPVYFETLAGALYYAADNAGKGDTANVKLFANDKMTAMTNIKTDGKIIIDFDGKTLKSEDFGSIVLKSGSLTITGDGNIDAPIVASDIDGKDDKFLTIENGTFTYSVTLYGTETTINGGKFADLQIGSGDKKFIINNGEFGITGISDSTNITLNGGTFTELYVVTDVEYDMNSLLGEDKTYSSEKDGELFAFGVNNDAIYGFDGATDGTVLEVKDKEDTDPKEPENPENPGETKPDDSGKTDDGFGQSKCKLLEKILEFFRRIIAFLKGLFAK